MAADEFDVADELLLQAKGDESVIRASGIVTRVALERYLFTVADVHSVQVIPAGRKAMAQDVLNSLHKQGLITAIQKSEFEGLFKVANNCAHPKEVVVESDVKRLNTRGRELSAVTL